jgi:uncharacterized membrane protein
MVWIHIVFGSISLITGAIALYALKGGSLHRKSGIFFAYAMFAMSLSGSYIAVTLPVRISVIAGLLAAYLVATSWLTVRQPKWHSPAVDAALMITAFITAVMAFYFGALALSAPDGRLDRFPSTPFFIFGSVALIGALLDLRMLIVKGVAGKHRIARHLWRMGFAMYIATSAFFLGQAQLFPEAVRKLWLLAIPVLLVLVTTAYWLFRTLRGRTQIPARETNASADSRSPQRAPVR